MLDERKKILVVSDNPELTRFFQEYVHQKKYNEIAVFQYRFSIINKNPRPMEVLGATPLDVKDRKFFGIAKEEYSLIISIHCKQIFPEALVKSVRCVNFHPGLNPFNRGWYPQVFSIINKKPIGATLHMMDAEVDHGAIIDQKVVALKKSDTSLDLYTRVLSAEKKLIERNLKNLVYGVFTSSEMEMEGNYNSKEDFEDLCNLDLNKTGTLEDHIDILRALTHGDFKNAYFFDEEGNKHYVRLIIEPDCK
ncbi:dTDP-4-amino-4,6-dideoxyglucose formyltransferase [Motiliproteus sediminis]|uniref:dTDP-4-amino-4,6-dideoxyglucose formyltransferase n=1 Tax=Motiliproteus sediminis TaxID=1468178 RepID=UPI001AEF8211|nr:dTDP-4-amino-4,6-dideoxyglucose formyltransferase [Motiliproteus sediminis]